MIVWRLTRAIYQDLSGTGGVRFQGRWNEAGLPIVYTSSSLALSILEKRVHSLQQPKDDVSIEIDIPSDSVEHIAPLRGNWKTDLALTRTIGSDWLRSNKSLCLRVPSAIVSDYNYLINPQHRDMRAVKVVAVKPFEYDPRLFKTGLM